jgi:hypothetical protein
MAKPKVIIFDSPSHKVRKSSIAIASAYAHNEYAKRSHLTDFFSVVYENVNRMFGLPMGTDAYKDILGTPHEHFFGYSPYDAYEHISGALCERYGKAFYGRVMARKLHRDSITDLYLVDGLCYTESVQAVAYEVKPENVLIIYVDGDRTGMRFEAYKDIEPIRRLNFPAISDYSILQMCIQGAVKGFIEQ